MTRLSALQAKDKEFKLPNMQGLLLVTSVLACHGQPRILDAVLLLLLSKQSSTVKVGDESEGACLVKKKGKDGLKKEGPSRIWITEC